MLLKVGEVAQKAGVTSQHISNLIKNGKITKNSDNLIEWDDVKHLFKKIDFNPTPSAPISPPQKQKIPEVAKSVQLKEYYKARSAGLDLKIAEGKVMDIAKAKDIYHKAFRTLRDNIMGLGENLAYYLATEKNVDKIQKKIDDEVTIIIKDFEKNLKNLNPLS